MWNTCEGGPRQNLSQIRKWNIINVISDVIKNKNKKKLDSKKNKT